MQANSNDIQDVPKGLIDTGQTLTLPLPIYDEMLESDPELALTTPIIPLYTAATWADERIFCAHLHCEDGEGAQTCSELRRDDGCHWCALNGPGAKTPCAFAEPEESEIWQWLRGYKKECEEKGWPLCAG